MIKRKRMYAQALQHLEEAQRLLQKMMSREATPQKRPPRTECPHCHSEMRPTLRAKKYVAKGVEGPQRLKHVGAYCSVCAKFLKWIGPKERERWGWNQKHGR